MQIQLQIKTQRHTAYMLIAEASTLSGRSFLTNIEEGKIQNIPPGC